MEPKSSSNMPSSPAVATGLWVEPSIYEILAMKGLDSGNDTEHGEQLEGFYSIDHATLEVHPSSTVEPDHPIELVELVGLARCAERTLYGTNNVDERSSRAPKQSDLQHHQLLSPRVAVLLREENVVFATLLSLNYLESAIRRDTGYTTGKAPLLKVMMGEINATHLQPILRRLLLPTWKGINLRNLVWHGFVGRDLPRAWLALIVVLLVNLHQQQNDASVGVPMEPPTPPFTRDFVETSTSRQLSVASRVRIRNWLVKSHRDLWDMAISWYDSIRRRRPACCLAVFCIILEHHLRLEWCRANNRQADALARHGSYYVTLDGHGQRMHHNLVLYPYYHDGEAQGEDDAENSQIPNQLVHHFGRETMAFLTDLFASPCGGPNIRAALAHGIWDHRLSRELLVGDDDHDDEFVDEKETEYLMNLTDLVLRGMEACSMASPEESRVLLSDYQPRYSYSAATQQLLVKALQSLNRLRSSKAEHATTEFASLVIKGDELCSRTNRLLNMFPSWATPRGYFEEHGTNSKLADCEAVRALLEEIEIAANQFSDTLQAATRDCNNADNLPSRRLKQAQRRLQMSSTVYTLYLFAMQVAVLFVETRLLDESDGGMDRSTALQTVKRTRMCVSTISTYLTLNPDRAMKCAREYARSKVVKSVLEYLADAEEADG